MKLTRYLFLACMVIFAGCADKIISTVHTFPLETEWKFSESGKGNWLPATVPGMVQTDLLKNGKIENPLFNANEQQLQWISEKNWTYQAVFHASDSLMKFKVVDFIFKGIDTYASVYLNDSLILQTDNMFREWTVNGRRFLKKGDNKLELLLHAPALKAASYIQKIPYRLPMSDTGDLKVSSFIRKAPYQFGWDWSPRFLTMGIWQPILIRAHDKVFISNIQIKTIEIADTCAWLSAYITIQSNTDLPNVAITVDDGFKQFKLKKGSTTTDVKFRIDNPELWWPNGYGKQPLYDVVARMYVNNYLVDTIVTRTGIRTVELFQDEDEWGTSFYFRINGLPVFMKGANYVPQSNFLTDVGTDDYKRLIGDVKSVGMNMLRVWGGGIYESDLFYDLCDENGIMIWQDFMFAGAMYPGDSLFTKNVKNEIEYQVTRLRNHPSIMLWCGNNEIDVAWKNWGWQKEYGYSALDSSTIYKNYLKLFEDTIPALLNKFDHTRPYISSSPISNWGKPENFNSGNMHYWGVWHGEESIDSLRANVPRFMTEYGMQSFPSYQTLRKNTTEERITLGSDFIKNRQRSYKGNGLLLDYIERQFGPAKNVEDLCYLSQLNQAEAMRIAIESHRKEARFCMGSLYWQLNDVWDGASWSTIEHDGTWKAAHYKLQQLYAKNILIAETVNDTTVVYLQSDNTEGVSGKLKVDVIDFKGRSLGTYWSEAATGYLVATKVFEMPLRDILKKHDKSAFFLRIQLMNGDEAIARNILTFVAPKEMKLPPANIQSEVIPNPDGAEIKLHTNVFAKSVMLSFENAEGKFSDNYFDLLPGEDKVVVFTGAFTSKSQLKSSCYNEFSLHLK